MEERIERMSTTFREKYAAIVVPATPSLFGLVTPRRFWLQLGLNFNFTTNYTIRIRTTEKTIILTTIAAI